MCQPLLPPPPTLPLPGHPFASFLSRDYSQWEHACSGMPQSQGCKPPLLDVRASDPSHVSPHYIFWPQWAKNCSSLGHQTELGSAARDPPLHCTSLRHPSPEAKKHRTGNEPISQEEFRHLPALIHLTKDAPLGPPLFWGLPHPMLFSNITYTTLKTHKKRPMNK